MAKALLEAGAKNKSMTNGFSALYIAAGRGHTAVVRVLLGAGADANKALKNGLKNGFTPLQVAVHGGHLAVVEALLEAGADAKVMRDDGSTALSIAMRGGKAAIVAALQRHEIIG